MATNLDIRQSVLRPTLNMNGNAANAGVDSVLTTMDAQIAKLFEDRNILLTDGGTVTFTGTQVQFTENLNLILNQKIAGTVPQIISLGSANQAFTNSGDMMIAVVNRTLGTAVVSIVTSGNALPAVAAANQEVFVIAVRRDAGDGTQRLYWRNGTAFNAGQSLRIGQGGGSGSGSGTGDDLDALQFRASFADAFTENSTNANSSVLTSGTNAAFSAAKAMWTMQYDASKTVTGSGTAMTLSGAPAFTVAVGDVLVQGTEARKIVTVTSQTVYVIESTFTLVPSPAAAQATVSQAVYTKDIYNAAVDGSAIATSFPGTTFSEILVDYKDNATASSNLWVPDVTPLVAFTATNNNTSFTVKQVRATNTTDIAASTFLPVAGSALFMRFFSNATSGSGFANLITYKVFMQKSTVGTAGGVMSSAYGLTNGVGTATNISFSVVGGKSTATLAFAYAVGANVGTPESSIEVFLNGTKVPRFVDSVTTPDAYFVETSANAITLDRDYSTQHLSLTVLQRTSGQPIDNSTVNATNIASQQEIMQNGFQSFVATNAVLAATTSAGTPIAGTFYSTIQNRAPLVDLTQDLKPRMGVERIMVEQIAPLQTEFGPNGEIISAAVNDVFGQIRYVGAWANLTDNNGSRPVLQSTTASTDAVEITFYGTGLNLLTLFNGTGTPTYSISIDGATATNLAYGTLSTILLARNYSPNMVIPAVSGLSLGVHTVRISRGTATSNLDIAGFEVLNVSANIITNPGVSYVNGKKLSSVSQSLIAYNAAVTGTRGGRVLQYQTAAGAIAQAWQPVNAASAFLTAADHTNEEAVRTYSWREFGAGRTDDFSRITASNQAAAFTLDDGTTSLACSSGSSAVANGFDNLSFGVVNAFYDFTFIGTGLDITFGALVATTNFSVSIDGGTAIVPSIVIGTNNYKIVSGLPYGTHVVKVTVTASISNTVGTVRFTTYQPKKPTLPSGAVELADYNVLATYVANTTIGAEFLATGVIRKISLREMNYLGTWLQDGVIVGTGSAGPVGGERVYSTTTGAVVKYTFFGTGLDLRLSSPTAASSYTVTIDGTTPTLAGATASGFYGNMTSFSLTTGVIGTNTTGSYASGVWLGGLPLGFHTVSLTFTSGQSMSLESVDIITPIYSTKNNLYSDAQNTLSVGSNSISDDRKFSAIKDSLPATKSSASAYGVSSSASTTSTVMIPCPDMSCTVKTGADGKPSTIDVSYMIPVNNSSGSQFIYAQVYVDGLPAGTASFFATPSAGFNGEILDAISAPVGPGVHKVDVYWSVGGGTGNLGNSNRHMIVRER